MVLGGNVLGGCGGYTEGARVLNNSDQNIVSGAEVTILFNIEDYDTDYIHSTVLNTGRLTCRTAGKYIISGTIAWQNNNVGWRLLLLRVNGLLYIGVSYRMPTTGLDTVMQVHTLFDLAVDDYVEMRGAQQSGGNILSKAYTRYSPVLAMQRIG